MHDADEQLERADPFHRNSLHFLQSSMHFEPRPQCICKDRRHEPGIATLRIPKPCSPPADDSASGKQLLGLPETEEETQLAVGRYVSDLDTGDVLGPVEYVLSPFVGREYAHSNEMHHPFFQGLGDEWVMPPTLIHLDKLRLYNHACPAGTGPDARIH